MNDLDKLAAETTARLAIHEALMFRLLETLADSSDDPAKLLRDTLTAMDAEVFEMSFGEHRISHAASQAAKRAWDVLSRGLMEAIEARSSPP